jgi:hypothetical protein
MTRSAGAWLAASIVAASATALASDAAFTGISLKVSEEIVPPGGMAQMKVLVTEPKPISTGRGRISSFRSTSGIAIGSPADDTFGVAVLEGDELVVSVRSRSATFGMGADDYPVLTIAGRVPATTPIGTRVPFRIDGTGFVLRDPKGAIYPIEAKDGSYTVARGVSIDDVRPGSANLPKGAVVTLLGTGFVRGTEIKFNEVKLAATRFISSSRIDVVLAQPARMHGLRIRARNPNGARTEYYSYQRTTRSGRSLFPVLRTAVPLLPSRTVTSAVVKTIGTTTGLALQNIGSQGAAADLELLAPSGRRLALVRVNVPAKQYVLREISELFGMSYPSGASVRVRATRPVQVMGVAVDGTRATPLLPQQ